MNRGIREPAVPAPTTRILETAPRLAVILGLAFAAAGCGRAQYVCRSRQTEAQASLKALHAAQVSYQTANKKYGSSLGDIGFSSDMARKYDLVVNAATATSYKATATGKAE